METEKKEKANLIKNALLIVDKLANEELDEYDGEINNKIYDFSTLQKLIEKSKKLKKNKYWKLT